MAARGRRSTSKKTARKRAGSTRRTPRKSATRKRPSTHRGTQIRVIPRAQTGPGGGEVILENERVRIWDISLEPGGRSALHTHLLDYILVQVEGDEICTEPHPDTQGEYNRRMILETRPGDTCYIEKGGTETAVNTGKKRWREICIELK